MGKLFDNKNIFYLITKEKTVFNAKMSQIKISSLKRKYNFFTIVESNNKLFCYRQIGKPFKLHYSFGKKVLRWFIIYYWNQYKYLVNIVK